MGREEGQLPRAGGLQKFLCGLGAGTLAKLGTHPLDVCKKRFQVRRTPRLPNPETWALTLMDSSTRS